MPKNRKRVLIVSYYWPPSGGIGVLRCLKIAKHLRRYGWEPVVYTAKDAHYPTIDHSNDHDIPVGMTILKQPIWEPYAVYKKLTGQAPDANVNNVLYVRDDLGWKHYVSVWLRSNFFIPDARARWIRPSVRYLTAWLRENPVDAILSNGPPHTNTRIATLLRRSTGIPWLADYQDPWTQVDYYQSLILTPWADRKHRRLEREAFATADKTTIVSWTWKEDLERIGARDVSVVPWGFDPDDAPPRDARPERELSFAHLGIMGYDRNPEVFFRVLTAMAASEPQLAAALRLRLVGQVDRSVQESYRRAGLERAVELVGNVSRQEALRLTAASPVLLLLLNQQPNAQGRIPGKLFEYLAARRPILALGPIDSDVARIIRETRSGRTCEYDDAEGIRGAVAELFQRYRHAELERPTDSDIDAYSQVNLVGQIAEHLDRLPRAPAAPRPARIAG